MNPAKSLKALETQNTEEAFSGKAEASSAVIRPSGIDHIKGKNTYPVIARRGPTSATRPGREWMYRWRERGKGVIHESAGRSLKMVYKQCLRTMFAMDWTGREEAVPGWEMNII